MYWSDVCVIKSISHPASFIVSRRGNLYADMRSDAWNTKRGIRVGKQLSALRWSNESAVRLTIRTSRDVAVLGRGRWSVSRFGRISRSPLVLMTLWKVETSTFSVRNDGALSKIDRISSASLSPRKLERWSISRFVPEDNMARNHSKLVAVPSSSKWERRGKDRIWKSLRSSSS